MATNNIKILKKIKSIFLDYYLIFLFFCFIFFINTTPSFCQNSEIKNLVELDSLEAKLKNVSSDLELDEILISLNYFKEKFIQDRSAGKNEEAFNLGFKLAELQRNYNLDSTLVWYYHCLDLATTMNHPSFLSKTLVNIGSCEFNAQNFKIAEQIAEQADSILKKHPNEELYLNNLYRLAEAYEYNDNPTGAMEKYFECHQLAEKGDNLRMLTMIDVKLGNINRVNEDYDKAYSYYEKAINRLDQSKHQSYYIFVMSNMAEAIVSHSDLYSEEQVIDVCSKVADILKENKESNNANLYFFNYIKNKCILKNGSQEEINSLPLTSIKELEKKAVNAEVLMTKLSSNFSIALKQKKYTNAKTYLEKIIEISKEGDEIFGVTKLSLELEKNFLLATGDYKSVIRVIEELHENQLELENENRMKSISNLEGVLKAKEAEFEIALLNKEKKILAVQSRQVSIIALSTAVLALIILGFLLNVRRKNKIISNQNEQLDTLNKTKDHIFAIIGHDLRKPAIAFKGITKKVNFLLKRQDFKTLNQLGEEIEKDAIALNKLTDNLLNWALMQKSIMPYHPTSISLFEVVKEVFFIFENTAKVKGISLTTNIPNDLKVFADQNTLEAIIRNLIDNSLKYTPKGGQVSVNANDTKQGVRLEVVDTGKGMSLEETQNIFLLNKDKSQKGLAGEKGTGLGMHLVNEFVKLNKGTIKVFSQLGEGTKFDLIFPKGN